MSDFAPGGEAEARKRHRGPAGDAPTRPVALALGVLLSVGLLAHAADDRPDGPRTVKLQVVGLFSEDRVADLRALFEALPKFKLLGIDFPNAEATVEFDPAGVWPGEKPERYVELFDNLLRGASRGSFGAKPLRTKPAEALRKVEIPVAGLDCKGCELAAYRLIYQLPGVETAQASFRAGRVTALIDPKETDRAKLEAALKKGEVDVRPAPR